MGSISDATMDSVSAELDRLEQMEQDEFEREIASMVTHGGNKHTARATKLHTIAEPSGSALRKLQKEEEEEKENRSVFEGMD